MRRVHLLTQSEVRYAEETQRPSALEKFVQRLHLFDCDLIRGIGALQRTREIVDRAARAVADRIGLDTHG